MNFNLKIYTLIEYNIMYIMYFFDLFLFWKLKVLKFKKRKKELYFRLSRRKVSIIPAVLYTASKAF
jgi:hypothetical protein